MKHPVWILNSILIILLALAVSFMFFAWQKPPIREDIEPSATASRPLKGEILQIDLRKIYEHDLFGTYKQELPHELPVEIAPIPLPPAPPVPKAVSVPPVPVPQFLEPLNITLKGIIVIHNDDSKNRAIISDNKTNQETIYQVGQTIEDAQIIRILSNKVIIARANGQQEILYLREKDAKHDPAYLVMGDWHDAIEKKSDTEFIVSPDEFAARVKDLSQFIDLLDLITVYKQGKSVGCRIGSTASDSLGVALGLQASDIITSINSIPTLTTADRFKIYKEVVALHNDDVISVTLLRDHQEIVMRYTIKQTQQPQVSDEVDVRNAQITTTRQPYDQRMTQASQQQSSFAPTLQEIRTKEKENMLRKGSSHNSINFKVADNQKTTKIDATNNQINIHADHVTGKVE